MAKLDKFEGDLFWNEADTESAVYDPDDELDNINQVGAIVEYEQAKRLSNFFGVDCGQDSEGRAIYEYFDSKEEAEKRSTEVTASPSPLPTGEKNG
jgi:hypothetical protein